MNEQELARLIATLAHLRHPFDRKQISKLPATDKRPALDYVNHAHVTNRLNEYAPDWSYTLDEMFTQDGACWVRGTMTIFGASRVEFGTGKNPLEATSHFIRRAAMRFGVATDLWAKEDFEDSADAPSPSSARQTGRGAGPSATPPLPPADLSGTPVPDATGEGGDEVRSGKATVTRSSPVATPQQWERLLAVSGGSKVRALNRLNKANHTAYTKETVEYATFDEAALAITGGT